MRKKQSQLHPQLQQSSFLEASMATAGRFSLCFLHQLETICIAGCFYFPEGCEETGAWS